MLLKRWEGQDQRTSPQTTITNKNILLFEQFATLALTDTEPISVEARGGHIVGSRFRSLRNPELAIIEATDGQDTHYVMVETPFRAFTVPVRKRVKHVWTYWGAISGQLRPALAAPAGWSPSGPGCPGGRFLRGGLNADPFGVPG